MQQHHTGRGDVNATFRCELGGYVITSKTAAQCEAEIDVLNSAVDSYLDGTFAECEQTTPTTTLTTTTTPTSTATTTAYRARLICVTSNKQTYVATAHLIAMV